MMMLQRFSGPSKVCPSICTYSVRLAALRYSTKVVTKTEENTALTEQEKALAQQAPNRISTWAKSQRPRSEALTGPRFVQSDLTKQPRPYAGIELINQQPIKFVADRIAVCDGGRGVQGHPKVYINLDQDGPNSCTYCGLRYQQEHHH
ncbi:uncharacterized protein V1516DRAFT_671546 [Lipomyces oligophaga]|uniref:uncharacterized protein n=1 Tax=Lipomyces oligophaga TaxID=45792 RepID=UPI0034CDA7FF